MIDRRWSVRVSEPRIYVDLPDIRNREQLRRYLFSLRLIIFLLALYSLLFSPCISKQESNIFSQFLINGKLFVIIVRCQRLRSTFVRHAMHDISTLKSDNTPSFDVFLICIRYVHRMRIYLASRQARRNFPGRYNRDDNVLKCIHP